MNFKKDLRDVHCLPCLCCYRVLSSTGAVRVKSLEAFKEKVNAKQKNLFERSIKVEDTLQSDCLYICRQCEEYLLKKGTMPPLSVMNGLECEAIPPELELNDLEMTLIARSILFLKIITLPKSQWSAIKDKAVLIPLQYDDVLKTLNTVSKLPRSPDDAGLVAIALRRKEKYKGAVLHSYINVRKLYEALK